MRCSLIAAMSLVASIAVAASGQLDPGGSGAEGSQELERGRYVGIWREVEEINPFLPPPDRELDLATPQSTLETFLLAARRGRFDLAAHALDFTLAEGDMNPRVAQRRAKQLHDILRRKLWIDWAETPDRTDGVVHGAFYGSTPLQGEPRRSIKVGEIDLDGRPVEVRLNRLKAPGQPPVWLFSRQTVQHIDELYERYGPAWMDRHIPEWGRQRGFLQVPVWEWVAAAVTTILAAGLAVLAAWLFNFIVSRHPAPWRHAAARGLRGPVGALVLTLILFLAKAYLLRMTGPVASIADPLTFVALVLAVAWLAMRLIDLAADRLAAGAIRHFDEEGSSEQRRVRTQVSVGRRVLMLLVVVVALGVVMLRLRIFEAVGLTLLASAGAGAIILGIAGHAVLGNIIAGLQIGITRPFRIGDSCFIEDNWGRIEDITYTYVVLRTWDERRLIFPIRYFMDNHFENWSKTDRYLVKPIYLYVDWTMDVQRVREKFHELLASDEDFDDRTEPWVFCYDLTDEAMVVRCQCGARDPAAAWFLHCRMREQLVSWLQSLEGGRYLPLRRLRVQQFPREDEEVAQLRDDRPHHAVADASRADPTGDGDPRR